ncbi:solute carrier family 23 protein [Morganella morganii]
MKTNTGSDEVNEMMPMRKLFPYAVQHIFAMFTGTIAVPIVISQVLKLSQEDTTLLIAAAIFVSGVGTLIQSLSITKYVGVSLPLILGTSFVAMPPVFIIASRFGGGLESLPYVFGGTLVSGVLLFFLAPLYGKIAFLFKPIVIGCYLIMLGVSLLPVSFSGIVGYPRDASYGDPAGIFLGVLTITVIVLLNRFGKGALREMSILIGLIVATLVAVVMDMVNFGPVSSAGWFSFVRPAHYGIQFDLTAIILMFLGTFMATLDSVGTFSTVGRLCNRSMEGNALNSPMRGEGVAVTISGLFNCTPLTSFINNAGVIIISGVRSRYVTACSGVILIILSIIPKFSAIATMIPASVFGGATLVIFAFITVAGIDTLTKSVDMTKMGNMMVVGISVSVGLMFNGQGEALSQLPEMLRIILSQGVIVTFVLAIVLNLLFNFDSVVGKKEKP